MTYEEWISEGDGANGLRLIEEVKTDENPEVLFMTYIGAKSINTHETCCMEKEDFDTEEDFQKAISKSREISENLMHTIRVRINELKEAM